MSQSSDTYRIDPAPRLPAPDLTEPPVPATEASQRSAIAFATTGIRIVVWTLANISFLLGAWVLLGWSAAGWSPIVVTTDSMRPTIDAGDVVLVADDLATGASDVIVFDDDEGGVVARRVLAIDGDSYVTGVGSNASPDTGLVARDVVRGTGRLVIPMAGLPVVWAQHGDWTPFAAWASLSAVGVIGTVRAVDRAVRKRRHRDDVSGVSVARLGIQRVRILTAILIFGQALIAGGGRPDIAESGTQLSLLAVGLLVAAHFLPAVQTGRGRLGERTVALVELVIDTSLVLILTATTETNLTWILFALPIIEAAVRFRLLGALVHWMVLAGVTLTLEVLDSSEQPPGEIVGDLQSQLEQLGVLFLFVIPAAYLAEQLIGEVGTWQRATGRARHRSELLARVADVGREVTRLEGSHVETILAGVRSVGFARADMVTDHSDFRWRVAAGDGLPVPGSPASGTRRADLDRRASIITTKDPDATERRALRAAGLDSVIAHLVSDQGGHRIVLRAATLAGDPITTERIEALRLLAGQATVALQNDRLMAEVTSMHDELEHRASHDGLTGLPNRTMMLRRLRDAQRGGHAPIVLFLDLDGFKPVNDRLGHDVGDVLLQRVADRLRATAPPTALVARLGGDEFTILLSGHDMVAAEALAGRVVEAITAPFELGDQLIDIGTSVGIADGGADLDDAEIVRRADVSMYHAKHGAAGRSIEVYRAEFDDAAERRARLVADIGRAVSERTLRLHYQPVVDTRSGDRIVGAEALVRWDHPVFGSIAPGEIVDVALKSNRSRELNSYVVQNAIEWIADAHRLTGDTDLFVAVNASPEELGSTSLADDLVAAAERAGVAPGSIALEISERIVTPVGEMAQRNMKELQAVGVRLLLDDFGEGTTSLTYLQELPIDGVKLDRRLVVNALRSRTDRLVLASIVELSHRIGHSVIAEGIESAAHLAAVVDAGCGLAQGYHLYEPMPGDRLIALLSDRVDEPGTTPDSTGSSDATSDLSPWTQPLVAPTAAPVGLPFAAPNAAHALASPEQVNH